MGDEMKRVLCLSIGMTLACGCVGQSGDERNAFLTFTENFGTTASRDSDDDAGGAPGLDATEAFRREMSLTFANNHPNADLEFSFIVWVLPNSIRNADQQDVLFRDNFVQLGVSVSIGRAVTLPPGTFVFNGPGVAGATSVRLRSTGAEGAIDPTLAQTVTFDFVTPDGILFFSQPPESCESVAFFFSRDGVPLTSEGQTGLSGVGNVFAGPNSPFGGQKTIAQVDAYQCDPFRPGLFLKIGGGALDSNEYFESQDIRVDFSPAADNGGFFANVTRSALTP